MTYFRLFLITVLIALVAYTAVVIGNHGWGLIPIFFGDMITMNWPGQFNFDFMTFLLLSGLWVLWRNAFSPTGFILAPFAVFGGMLFLSVYLLFLTHRHKNDMAAILMGPTRT